MLDESMCDAGLWHDPVCYIPAAIATRVHSVSTGSLFCYNMHAKIIAVLSRCVALQLICLPNHASCTTPCCKIQLGCELMHTCMHDMQGCPLKLKRHSSMMPAQQSMPSTPPPAHAPCSALTRSAMCCRPDRSHPFFEQQTWLGNL